MCPLGHIYALIDHVFRTHPRGATTYALVAELFHGLCENVMPSHEVKNMSASTEVRKFEHGMIELVDIGGGTVGRFVLQKGWKWSSEVCNFTMSNLMLRRQ